jgi:hypothetical protein
MLSLLVIVSLSACGRAEREREAAVAAALAQAERVMFETVRLADGLAGSADRILRPLPVMTPAEENELRTFTNVAHVARARELGVQAVDSATVDSLLSVGSLVQLEDSTRHWIVRPGTSPAYVIPDLRSLLRIVGERFHERLAEMDLPPYRIEVTSALRTSARQARLRRTNANAAAGVSSHEFGTTVDVSYSAFAPPAELLEPLPEGLPPEFGPHLRRIVDLALESVSARKSRELGKIFSGVLAEAQAEGLALVIYERQQTVYHLTVGRKIQD